MIERGDKIIIKGNLFDVMTEMKFEKSCIKTFSKKFTGTEQIARDIWMDHNGQEYVTIDLCCEIPIQCCELKSERRLT